MHTRIFAFLVVLSLLPLSLVAQESVADPEPQEPRWSFDLERSSHIVRSEDERFNFDYNGEVWRFGALVGSQTPFFEDSRDLFGLSAGRRFGRQEIRGVLRYTEKTFGEDVILGVHYARELAGGSRLGVELISGSADLGEDAFLDEFDANPVVGRLFWSRADDRFGVELLFADTATFDFNRSTDDLLRRLPRSILVGVETLADVNPDEARLETSAGLRVHWKRDAWDASVYAKSGDQTLRGLPVADDMLALGGDLELHTGNWRARVEVDLRQIDLAGGFGDLDRGRVLIDLGHRLGRLSWGLGTYVQGEAESFADIVDVYDTAGIGARLGWRLGGGRGRPERTVGIWLMYEEDAPDFQKVGRLAVFYKKGDMEYGVGLRRDEVGRRRFRVEDTGPLFIVKRSWRNLHVDLDLAVVDGEGIGRLSIGFRR